MFEHTNLCNTVFNKKNTGLLKYNNTQQYI